MTVIAAIRDANGDVYMAADSAGTSGWSQQCRVDKKIKRVGNMLIGFTSSYRMGQLLHYKLTPPEHPKDMHVDVYIRTLFVDTVRELFVNNGYAYIDNNREEGGIFLVAYQGHIFRIDSDYQVGEHVEGFDAVGSGEDLAIGALYATGIKPAKACPKRVCGHSMRERVELAVQCAIKFNAGCNGEIQIEKLEYLK